MTFYISVLNSYFPINGHNFQTFFYPTSFAINSYIGSFDNRFEVNWPPEPTLVLRWISKFFLFGALPIDILKIKHTKNLKEIPS